MSANSDINSRRERTELPASYWRGLILVAMFLGVAWINTSRLPVAVSVGAARSVFLFVGLLIGADAVLLLIYRRHRPTSLMLDRVALASILGLIVLALGQFAAGVHYGAPTVLPWGINLWGIRRHPVQLYEATALAAVLVTLRHRMSTALPGEIFWHGALYVGVIELVLETFRNTTHTVGLGIRQVQVIALSVVLLALSIISLYAAQRRNAAADLATQYKGRAKPPVV